MSPSPFGPAASLQPLTASPFQPQQQQQQQQPFVWGAAASAPAAAASPFGGGFGSSSNSSSSSGFGASTLNPFSQPAASTPFCPAPAAAAAAPAAAAAAADDATPMALQKETKGEKYTEAKIFIEAWRHLQTAKKSGCWPFTSKGLGFRV